MTIVKDAARKEERRALSAAYDTLTPAAKQRLILLQLAEQARRAGSSCADVADALDAGDVHHE